LNKYTGDPEAICRGCRLFATKPDNAPADLRDFISLASELDELTKSGAKFIYPDSLMPVEWASLAGLERGRGRAESDRAARERKKARNGGFTGKGRV
jgi:hypothetical protein